MIQTNRRRESLPDPLSWASSFYQGVRRPYQWALQKISPEVPSSLALNRISEAAEKGLARAKIRTAIPSITTDLHGSIDMSLAQRGVQEPVPLKQNITHGEVADIRGLAKDPEVTRAAPLQARFEATNWNAKIAEQQSNLVNKLSAFTALLQMKSLCGIEKENTLSIIDLVKKATEGASPPTIWKLFTENYNLSFFQTLKAAWVYWLYFQTSLITNTVDAYLGKFIQNIRGNLSEENNPTRTYIFRTLIENTHDFLLSDLEASKRFACQQESGTLDKCQYRAIRKHYGSSLSALCEAFAENRVNTDSPNVKFFEKFQKIPIIGLAFMAFEWLVNKLLIQRIMKNAVLPSALENGVKNGLEATKPDKLPFVISLTQFFNAQLEKFKLELDNQKSSIAMTESPGTEELPGTIITLLRVLAIEGIDTPPELKRKIEAVTREESWYEYLSPRAQFDKKVSKTIEKTVVEGGYKLFEYLHKAAQSGELFANFLELSLKPFSGDIKNEALLRAELEEESLKFKRTSDLILDEIVESGVSEVFSGKQKEDVVTLSNRSFEAQQIVAEKLFADITAICDRMAQKIEASKQNPIDENNIQVDIALVLQHMQVLASRKELQDALEHLDGTNRNALWKIVNPLFEQAEEIQNRILALQELQDHHPTYAKVVDELETVGAKMRSLRNNPLQPTVLEALSKISERLRNYLGNEQFNQTLNTHINQIRTHSENLTAEKRVFDAIYALYPPRLPGDSTPPNGLIDQMLAYEMGTHPYGFKPRACLEEMKKHLSILSEQERSQLEQIIGNGSQLRSKWSELGETLQRIYSRHLDLNNQYTNSMNAALDKAVLWADDKKLKYTIIKDTDHEEMQAEIREISEGFQALKERAKNLKFNPSKPLTTPVKQVVSVALPAAISYFSGGLLGQIASALASFAGGAASKHLRTSNNQKVRSSSSIAQKVLGIFGMGAASYFAPAEILPAAAAATGFLTGWTGREAVQTYSETAAKKKVKEVFYKARKLSLNPRIYAAATTRVMKAMVDA